MSEQSNKLRRGTILALGTAIVGLIAWDVFVVAKGGEDATISEVGHDTVHRHPWIAVALGFVLGHVTWAQHGPNPHEEH